MGFHADDESANASPGMPLESLPRRTVLHFESAGEGSAEYPIEVGIAHEDRRTACTLISPHEDWYTWDKTREAVHGITPELLHAHGLDTKRTVQWLDEQLRGQDVYCDDFEHTKSLLACLYKKAEAGTPAFRLRPVEDVLGPIPLEVWREQTVDVKQSGGMRRHRASYEARVRQVALSDLVADADREHFYPETLPPARARAGGTPRAR